jgi:hypothetical protein
MLLSLLMGLRASWVIRLLRLAPWATLYMFLMGLFSVAAGGVGSRHAVLAYIEPTSKWRAVERAE